MNCYPFIEAEKSQRRNVKRVCELLKVSRAAFYQHLAGPSQRDRADAGLTSEVRAVHEQSKGRYGAPRIHAELQRVAVPPDRQQSRLQCWSHAGMLPPPSDIPPRHQPDGRMAIVSEATG